MDLITLGLKIKKDSLTYRNEFLDEIRSIESLITLPNPPIKQIKPVLSFIIRYCHVDAARSVNVLASSLAAIKDVKTRKVILGGLILIRQKKLLSSKDLFKYILMYGNDYRAYLKGCTEFLEIECYDTLVEWYHKGTERQQSFCYYFLLIIFGMIDTGNKVESDNMGSDEIESQISAQLEFTVSAQLESAVVVEPIKLIKYDEYKTIVNKQQLEEIICEALFKSKKISKICMLYFLNRTEIKFDISKIENGFQYGKRIYKELLEEHFDRDVKIMKLKIYVLFKKHFKIKNSVTNIILKMMDVEKEDLKDLLDCLVKSVSREEAQGVLRIISVEFVNETRDEDIICYGMNLMREIYYRLAGLTKESNICLNESESVESEDFDLGDIENNSNEEDEFIRELKESILKYIECFKGNRTKSIYFAYKALINAVIKNQAIDRPTTFIRKSATKEEKEALRKKGSEESKRERLKENYENKKKKKGGSKNKKNRLFLTSKKAKKNKKS